MRGPAMPKNSAVGKCCLSASMRPAPSRSPEASPATSAMRRVMNSAQDAAAGLFQEADHLLHLRCRLREFAHLRECILQGEIAAVKKLVGAAQLSNGLGAETAATQTLDVEAVRRGRMARHHHERRHILGDAAAERGEAVLAETAELMYLAEAAKDRVILDPHMAGQRGIVGEDGERPDVDIRRQRGLGGDVRARSDQTTISLRAHMRSALATTRPATFTSPLNFQLPRTARVSRTSKLNCSPGSTGCLNRALLMAAR